MVFITHFCGTISRERYKIFEYICKKTVLFHPKLSGRNENFWYDLPGEEFLLAGEERFWLGIRILGFSWGGSDFQSKNMMYDLNAILGVSG